MAGTWSESTFQDLQNILICFWYLLIKMIGFYQGEWKSWVIFCCMGKEFAKGTTEIDSSLCKSVAHSLSWFHTTLLHWAGMNQHHLISCSLVTLKQLFSSGSSRFGTGQLCTFLPITEGAQPPSCTHLHRRMRRWTCRGGSGLERGRDSCCCSPCAAAVAMQRHPTCWKGSVDHPLLRGRQHIWIVTGKKSDFSYVCYAELNLMEEKNHPSVETSAFLLMWDKKMVNLSCSERSETRTRPKATQ